MFVGRSASRDTAGGKDESLLLHHAIETFALFGIDPVVGHFHEFDSPLRDAEYVVGRSESFAARSRFEQLVESDLRTVQFRGRRTEDEIAEFDLAGVEGDAVDAFGQTALFGQPAGEDGGHDAVELPFGIGISGRIVACRVVVPLE